MRRHLRRRLRRHLHRQLRRRPRTADGGIAIRPCHILFLFLFDNSARRGRSGGVHAVSVVLSIIIVVEAGVTSQSHVAVQHKDRVVDPFSRFVFHGVIEGSLCNGHASCIYGLDARKEIGSYYDRKVIVQLRSVRERYLRSVLLVQGLCGQGHHIRTIGYQGIPQEPLQNLCRHTQPRQGQDGEGCLPSGDGCILPLRHVKHGLLLERRRFLCDIPLPLPPPSVELDLRRL
mmetsp:Transcript_31779/g.72989  ORF Transcript_31779/g.72989 Transcript_31779/m.72989 type:complete len:231 (+) Transcript_31779:443-1135(+)